MNNHAAIASTLGIGTSSAPAAKQISEPLAVASRSETLVDNESEKPHSNQSAPTEAAKRARQSGGGERKAKDDQSVLRGQGREAQTLPSSRLKANPARANVSTEVLELPLLIEVKRKFPGKELFVLSLLYLQRNKRGLVQMTVNSMMTIYSAVFEDVIKDDTVRRSLKRLSDAGFIKTTSIPGNNSGYVYEIEDLLQADNLTATEKEEFAELTAFVQNKLNLLSGANR